MKKIGKMFSDSLSEFKEVKTVVLCALFAAIAVVLGYVATIQIGDYIKIGFSGIPNQIVAMLFGPVIGGIFGGTLDVIKFLIKPTGVFFPGFTLNAMLAGVLYGVFLYKKKPSFIRILIVHFVVCLVINVGLNTYWLSILYGKGFLVLLPLRALKNVIMWPIDSAIFYGMTKALDVIIKPYMTKNITKNITKNMTKNTAKVK